MRPRLYYRWATGKSPTEVAFGPDACELSGMASVRLVVSTTKRLAPLVSEALFLAGAEGIEERPARGATLVTYGQTQRAVSALWRRTVQLLKPALGALPLPQVTVELDTAETWRSAWTAHLRPVALTRRLVLAPESARPAELPTGRACIVYRPALAFGDGDHPTTRLAARAVETHFRRAPGGALLDIGAGTGVLSFVALSSGAARAVGTDVDPEALRAAAQNAKLNGLARRARFVRAGAALRGTFSLVVVNIELRPLLTVLADLPAAARRAPKLLVTGYLATQAAEVAEAVKRAGFVPHSRKAEGDWRLLEARR
jgi:ribosomal protein L11 methyltransferase